MSRLTKKATNCRDIDRDNPYHFADEDISIVEVVDKLGKLEDIEEQLGCPIDVVFKALKDGIWSANYITYKYTKIHRFICINAKYYLVIEDSYYETKDYKKTWFLKEDKKS